MKAILLIAVTLLTCNVFAADTTFVTVQIGGVPKSAPITIKDQVTGLPVTAAISNVSVQNNNPELATIAPSTANANYIKATAIAIGSGTAVVSCQVTYTDPGDGLQKTENKSIVISYTVIGTPNGIKISLPFN